MHVGEEASCSVYEIITDYTFNDEQANVKGGSI